MNMSDAERTRPVIEQMGYRQTDNEEEADLLGILACSVRQKAIDKVYSRIHQWNRMKERRPMLTFLTGCVLPADHEKFLGLFDIVFPMSELQQLPEMIRHYGVVTPASISLNGADAMAILNESGALGAGLKLNEHIRDFWQINPLYSSPFEAFVPIQNGCDKFCTFCAVPYTRGREISRPSGEIMEEVASLVEHGYKSIILLGQNVNSYGLDRKGDEITFPELMRRIGELGIRSGREFWVYFTSPHPRDMTREVVEVIAEYPHLARQVHLPLQSGDDKVLVRMNRKYNLDQYRAVTSYTRELLPETTLFTDIIVGFTGETDEQFENTRKALKEFRFNMAYIARYSPRPGATSARWKDDVPFFEKKKRFHILSQDLMEISLDLNRQMVGKIFRVLLRGKDRKQGYLSGHTEGRITVRVPSSGMDLCGQMVDVRITDAAVFSVEGVII